MAGRRAGRPRSQDYDLWLDGNEHRVRGTKAELRTIQGLLHKAAKVRNSTLETTVFRGELLIFSMPNNSSNCEQIEKSQDFADGAGILTKGSDEGLGG